jgi:hypothetical protein
MHSFKPLDPSISPQPSHHLYFNFTHLLMVLLFQVGHMGVSVVM